jgi:hypothetical protein
MSNSEHLSIKGNKARLQQGIVAQRCVFSTSPQEMNLALFLSYIIIQEISVLILQF